MEPPASPLANDQLGELQGYPVVISIKSVLITAMH